MMFNFGKKKPEAEMPKQSQSMSGIGGSGQQVQGGRDAIATQSAQQATQHQGLTGAEVAALLGQLQQAIEGAALDAAVQEELVDYLKVVKREAQKDAPNKELMAGNLKQVGEVMKELKETTEAGKSLWQTGGEVLKAIAPWLGMAASVFGVM
ncbi:hypothetical protein ACN4EG_26125 [Alkalinema pantanalense CENA528]|uniref:hypothetical protein n=1 Tax=Alkalinema pantanalense TaxID=1620705 RepID=UPI003D6FA90F